MNSRVAELTHLEVEARAQALPNEEGVRTGDRSWQESPNSDELGSSRSAENTEGAAYELKLVERLLEASPRAGDTRRIAGLVRLGHLLHRRIEDLWELGEEPQPAPERVDLLLCHLCDGD